MELSGFILGLTGIIGSLSVATVTILSYRRNRKLENENTIYKLKVEGYMVTMEQIISIIRLVQKASVYFDDAVNNGMEKYDADAMNRDAKRINRKAVDLFNLSAKYAMIFPESILIELEKMHNFLFEEAIQTQEEGALTNYNMKMTEQYEQLIELADTVQQFMREDLHTERLNKSLFRRLK